MCTSQGLPHCLTPITRLPRWLSGKESACQCRSCRDAGLIPGSGRSPGERNGNPLQYSCLVNLMDREAWWVTVHGVTKSQTQLSYWSYTHAITLINPPRSQKGKFWPSKCFCCFYYLLYLMYKYEREWNIFGDRWVQPIYLRALYKWQNVM